MLAHSLSPEEHQAHQDYADAQKVYPVPPVTKFLTLHPAQALVLAGYVEAHDAIPGVHPDDLEALKTGRATLVDWATMGCICDYIPGVLEAVRSVGLVEALAAR